MPTRTEPRLSQCGGCAVPPLLEWLATLAGIAIVLPTAAGCAASFARLGRQSGGAWLYCCDLTEADLVLGLAPRLQQMLRAIEARHRPTAIYVAPSCGSGVTGDEIAPLLAQWQPDGSARLIPLVCEIYGKKGWSNGFDPRRYPLLSHWQALVPEPTPQPAGPWCNLLDFSRNQPLLPLIRAAALPINYLIRQGRHDSLRRLTPALGTLQLSHDRFAGFLSQTLQAQLGIPQFSLPLPYGNTATCACLTGLAEATGHPGAFAPLLEQALSQLHPLQAQLRHRLAGVRVLLVAGQLAAAKLRWALEELGLICESLQDEGEPPSTPFNPPRRSAPGRPRRQGGFTPPPTPYQLQSRLQARLQQAPSIDFLLCQHDRLRGEATFPAHRQLWCDPTDEFAGFHAPLRLGQAIASRLGLPVAGP